MEKSIALRVWTILLLLASVNTMAQKKENVELFPSAQEGWEKIVVDLPLTKKGGEEYMVEFTIGVEMMTDACNPYSLIGTWSEMELKGTPYAYYVASTKGQVVKAMSDCTDEKEELQFVGVKSKLILHEREQPLVVYIPEGYQLRYRLWNTNKEWESRVAGSKTKNNKK